MLDTVILQPVMQTKGFLMSLLTLTYVRLNSLKLKKKIKADLQKKKFTSLHACLWQVVSFTALIMERYCPLCHL